MNSIKSAFLALMLLGGSAFLVACDDEGPLERAGETADEAVDDAGDAVDDATN
jgi:tRNA A37 threonylcarbamoyltransferase TsaD